MDEAGGSTWVPPNPDYPPPKPGEPLLHRAARLGDHEHIRRLVRSGTPVDELFDVALDPDGRSNLVTPLMQAAASMDGASVETVQLLLDLGASIDPPLLEPVLLCAAGSLGWNYPRGGDADRMAAVLGAARTRGLAPTGTVGEGSSTHHVLAAAARTGDPERVQLLIDAGLDPDPGDLTWEWQWPLSCAVESGSTSTVDVLLGAGADPNKRLGRFSDPLLADVRSPSMLELLLDGGASVEPPMVGDGRRYTEPDGAERVLLGIAGASDLSEVQRALLLQQVIEACSLTKGQVDGALGDAVFGADSPAVAALLRVGGDPFVRTNGGASLLARVCFGAGSDDEPGNRWTSLGVDTVIGLLIDAGLDPNDEDEGGRRPLLTAVSPDTFGSGYQESDGYSGAAALALIRRGAEVNLTFPPSSGPQLEPPEVAGWTPLLVAAHFGDAPVVQALLEVGADPSARTPDGRTTVALAKACLAALEAEPPLVRPDGGRPYQLREFERAIQAREIDLRDARRTLGLLDPESSVDQA